MKRTIKLTSIGLIALALFSCNNSKPQENFDANFFLGKWTYRSLNNISDENVPFCRVDTTGKKDSCKCKSDLEFATAIMKFDKVSNDSIFGILDMGEGYILNLKGKITTCNGSTTFSIQGPGVPNSNTDNWEYDYQGYISPKWSNGINQLDACVGSVIRAKPHGESKVGKTASFYMVRQ